MRNNCKAMYVRLSAIMLSAACLSFVSWGCVNDEPVDSRLPSAADIAFGAMMDNGSKFVTRTGERIPINPDDFQNTVFYIYESGTSENKETGEVTPEAAVRPYWLASGMEGQLDIMSGYENDRLNWFAPDTKHLFWSWTWPTEERDYSYVDVENKPENEVLIFMDSAFPTPDVTNTETRVGEDGEDDGDDDDDDDDPEVGDEPQVDLTQEWHNGSALEYLLGALTERPYVFNEDGRYVPITYKHLVSKIILGDFWLVDSSGSTQKELMARITFYGMPKRAMFFPMPADDAEGNKVAPYVTIDYTDPYGQIKGADEKTAEAEIIQKVRESAAEGGAPFRYELSETLSFYILNKGQDKDNTGKNPDEDPYANSDLFYICPDVDFSNLEYKVEFVELDEKTNTYIPHRRYGNKGGFFGDFKSVLFNREVDGSDVPTTDRVLHAGEVMVLNMIVYEKSGPGAGVWIRTWSNEKIKSATHHVHNGIYSDAEAQAVRTAFQSTSTDTANKDASYAIYGEDDEDGHKVIRLYHDVTVTDNADPFDFYLYYPPDNDIVLDGMGYTINFYDSSSKHEVFKTFKIGNMRDVYISNGLYTVYIDEQGRICRMNKDTGKYDPTDETWEPNITSISFESPA